MFRQREVMLGGRLKIPTAKQQSLRTESREKSSVDERLKYDSAKHCPNN